MLHASLRSIIEMVFGPERRIQAQGRLMECCAPPFTCRSCISRLGCRWVGAQCTAHLIHLHIASAPDAKMQVNQCTTDSPEYEHPVCTWFSSESQIFTDGSLPESIMMSSVGRHQGVCQVVAKFKSLLPDFPNLALSLPLLPNLHLIYIWVAPKCASLHLPYSTQTP